MATKQKPITTSGLEKQLLQQYAKSAPLVLVRFKAQAVLLASNGVAITAIGDVMDKKPRTVELWLRNWHDHRLGSLFTGHQANNNAGKLTLEQKAEIQQALQSPPSDFGLPKEFWDVPQLKEYVTTQFGVEYECSQSYYFLLKFSNLSFKYADTFDRKRDEVFIAGRMQAIHTELAPLMADDSWEVFACDEVRVDQEAIIRKAWLKRGEKTVVKVNRNKESQSYIGFLNQKNGICETFEISWQNSEEVLKACTLFLAKHPGKKVCIIWDNAAFHKSKAIREQLKTGGLLERVHLIAMPPYAPDHNPIEHVWGVTKQAIANVQYPSFKETKQAFASFVSSRVFEFTF